MSMQIGGRMSSRRLAKIIGPLSVPCLLLGLLFFAASLTPSLLPRGPAVQGILGSKDAAEVFLLSLDGLQGDLPSAKVLRRRVELLIERFVAALRKVRGLLG